MAKLFISLVPADVLEQLQAADVVTLLQAALDAGQQQGTGERMEQLFHLPAAQAVDGNSVYSLLMRAVQQGAGTSVTALCKLPAAHALDADSVCNLLRSALQHCSAEALTALCNLEGAQQLDESSINSLIVEAVVQPAAHNLSADSLPPIVCAAPRPPEDIPLTVLLQLPEVARVPGAASNLLLHAAAHAVTLHGCSRIAFVDHLTKQRKQFDSTCMDALLSVLPAVMRHSSGGSSGQPVATCLCSEGCRVIAHLVYMLVEHHRTVPAGALANVLQAAQRVQRSSAVWRLLDLPAAMGLQEELVAGCMQQALQDDCRRAPSKVSRHGCVQAKPVTKPALHVQGCCGYHVVLLTNMLIRRLVDDKISALLVRVFITKASEIGACAFMLRDAKSCPC